MDYNVRNGECIKIGYRREGGHSEKWITTLGMASGLKSATDGKEAIPKNGLQR